MGFIRALLVFVLLTQLVHFTLCQGDGGWGGDGGENGGGNGGGDAGDGGAVAGGGVRSDDGGPAEVGVDDNGRDDADDRDGGGHYCQPPILIGTTKSCLPGSTYYPTIQKCCSPIRVSADDEVVDHIPAALEIEGGDADGAGGDDDGGADGGANLTTAPEYSQRPSSTGNDQDQSPLASISTSQQQQPDDGTGADKYTIGLTADGHITVYNASSPQNDSIVLPFDEVSTTTLGPDENETSTGDDDDIPMLPTSGETPKPVSPYGSDLYQTTSDDGAGAQECKPGDGNDNNLNFSPFGSASADAYVLNFADGYKCYGESKEAHDLDDLVSCYMAYFGFDHSGGFKGCQRTTVDLGPIFQLVQHYTSCDLVNEADNAKCVKRAESVAVPSGVNSFRAEYKTPYVEVNSSRNYVQMSYDTYAKDGQDAYGGGSNNYPYYYQSGNNLDDGPYFPRYRGQGNSFKLTKRGQFNANYSMEFNAKRGYRRMLLLLTGKEQMWFRLHCYLCGAWMEVRTNCTHRVISYSANKPTMYIPLNNTDGRCALWTGGETEETLKREEEHKKEEEAEKSSSEELVHVKDKRRGAIYDDIIVPIRRKKVRPQKPVPVVEDGTNTETANPSDSDSPASKKSSSSSSGEELDVPNWWRLMPNRKGDRRRRRRSAWL